MNLFYNLKYIKIYDVKINIYFFKHNLNFHLNKNLGSAFSIMVEMCLTQNILKVDLKLSKARVASN